MFLAISFSLRAKERYHYFSSPAYVHSFEDLDAKIWVLINRIPELEWKNVVIPPARNKVTLLPKVILLSGKFQSPGKGKRSLIVNGTRVKVSEEGDFVLRVLTQGSEFGLLVALRDLDQTEDLQQTVGMRIYSKKKENRGVATVPRAADFVGTYVFSQRKVASLEPSVASGVASDALATDLREGPRKDPFNLFEISLGASLGNYTQEDFYRQSPKSSYLRLNLERNLNPDLGVPLLVGLDGRFSLLAFNSEAAGTLQFVNPEVKVGFNVLKGVQGEWSIFTGTNYYTTFGNDFLGASSLFGQSLITRWKWTLTSHWGLDLYGRLLYFPQSGSGSFLSSRELLGGIQMRKNTVGGFSWGLFSEVAQARLKFNQSVESTLIRLGVLASF